VFAGYNNYVLRDENTSAQIVLSQCVLLQASKLQADNHRTNSTSTTRLITAFPNGNTGALVYLLPYGATDENHTVAASLLPEELSSVAGDYNQTGVTGQITLDTDTQFGVTLRE
jgi:hypothetical protein